MAQQELFGEPGPELAPSPEYAPGAPSRGPDYAPGRPGNAPDYAPGRAPEGPSEPETPNQTPIPEPDSPRTPEPYSPGVQDVPTTAGADISEAN